MLTKFLGRIGLLAVAMCVVNALAILLSWYYTVWWFDMPMHFFGGLFVSLLTTFFLERYISSTKLKTIVQKAIFVILCTMLIAILWEYFEIIVNNILAGQPFSLLDTFSDVFFDLAGASLGIVYVSFRYNFFLPEEKMRYTIS